jgi:hypothetical protein
MVEFSYLWEQNKIMSPKIKGPVGRFQVMATLQAARAYVLGLPLDSAKSFGLNRAIFYAAAKKGFIKSKEAPKTFTLEKAPVPKEKLEEVRKTFKIYRLGDEMAYSVELDGKPFFVIGNEIQTPESFEKQIERRFRGKFDAAFEEAVKICKSVDRGVLLSQRYFYEVVYKPRRDVLAEKWSLLVKEEETKGQ